MRTTGDSNRANLCKLGRVVEKQEIDIITVPFNTTALLNVGKNEGKKEEPR